MKGAYQSYERLRAIGARLPRQTLKAIPGGEVDLILVSPELDGKTGLAFRFQAVIESCDLALLYAGLSTFTITFAFDTAARVRGKLSRVNIAPEPEPGQ